VNEHWLLSAGGSLRASLDREPMPQVLRDKVGERE
jgi:hypothetical protein